MSGVTSEVMSAVMSQVHSALDHQHRRHLKLNECEEEWAFSWPIFSEKLKINMYEVEVLEASSLPPEREAQGQDLQPAHSLGMSFLCAFLPFPLNVFSLGATRRP